MTKLKLLQRKKYVTLSETDPLIYYYWPIFGPMYRRRVEICLDECRGGQRILEVGYGSGVTFLNLSQDYKEIYGIDLFADAKAVTKMWEQEGLTPELEQGDLVDLPYEESIFDTVLLISILEHLKPHELVTAMEQVYRVLKPNGQMVYGVPVERPFTNAVYRLMGVNIRAHHFSTEKDVRKAAETLFSKKNILSMDGFLPFVGSVYEVGHFVKA
jgi:ubiquinone/menaquinone biosynthesis C-methylase UbiE